MWIYSRALVGNHQCNSVRSHGDQIKFKEEMDNEQISWTIHSIVHSKTLHKSQNRQYESQEMVGRRWKII